MFSYKKFSCRGEAARCLAKSLKSLKMAPSIDRIRISIPLPLLTIITHSLTAALDQLRVVASSTSNDPGPRSRQHQQIGRCLLTIIIIIIIIISTFINSARVTQCHNGAGW